MYIYIVFKSLVFVNLSYNSLYIEIYLFFKTKYFSCVPQLLKY